MNIFDYYKRLLVINTWCVANDNTYTYYHALYRFNSPRQNWHQLLGVQRGIDPGLEKIYNNIGEGLREKPI